MKDWTKATDEDRIAKADELTSKFQSGQLTDDESFLYFTSAVGHREMCKLEGQLEALAGYNATHVAALKNCHEAYLKAIESLRVHEPNHELVKEHVKRQSAVDGMS